jgi:GNAT superfamily N-acetyltransferase
MPKTLTDMRADFQHLRRWRKSVEQAQSYTFKAVITIIVSGFLGAVWLGVKAMLGSERWDVATSDRDVPSVCNGKELRMYRIREVDVLDDEVVGLLTDLHRTTFLSSAPLPRFEVGHWWVASQYRVPVAFAGLVPSVVMPDCGYFCRVGVIRSHCGRGLQLRLMRVSEQRARHNGWHGVISDTTDNVVSANNFIRAGYRMFEPRSPWGWAHTLYWRKMFKPLSRSSRLANRLA